MSNFKIGEKVVFIHKEGCIEPNPEINSIVTISKIANDGWLGIEGFYFMEWEQHHFRKLDHQFAQDLCAQLIEEFQKDTVYN